LFNKEITIPALREAEKIPEVKTYLGEPHGFASASTPALTTRPAAAGNAFEDISTVLHKHLPTKPRPIDPKLVKHVAFEAKQ
jgi:hypothetical protein